jgi:hypothetical protein
VPERRTDGTATDRVATVVAGGLGAWCCVLALTNLPSRSLDRARGEDRLVALLPNYRLFAPSPVTRDVRLVYRCVRAGETDPGWLDALRPTPRHWRHAFWHPEVRRDKALLDMTFDLVRQAPTLPPDRVRALTSHRILAGIVRGRVPRGDAELAVQFALLRHDGYADGVPTLEFLSDVLPVGDAERGPG